jgi:hypothetical protein
VPGFMVTITKALMVLRRRSLVVDIGLTSILEHGY